MQNPWFISLLLAVFVFGCKAPPPHEVRTYCSNADQPFNGLITDSPIITSGFGGNELNQRFSENSDINSGNIAQLQLRYSITDPKADIRRGAPAATADTLYMTTEHQVYAIDRKSGCVFWEQQLTNDVYRSASVLLFDLPENKQRLVVVGTKKAEVIALDAASGERQWQVFAGHEPQREYAMITGGLQYFDGHIYVPIASEEVAKAVTQLTCCDSHGALRVLKASTGEELWTYETTAPAQQAADNPLRFGPNGVSVWSTPLIDSKRHQVLIGTSQNFTDPATHNADAVVALDMTTGKERWVFKATEVDYYNATCGQDISPIDHCPQPSYDYDVVTPLLSVDHSGIERIIAADKGGWVYALEPETGKRIWQQKIGAGGLLGGIHWAVAADREQVYAGVADFKVPKISLIAGEIPPDLLNISPGPVEAATPGVYALDLATGEVNWAVNDSHVFEGDFYPSVYSAALSVVNDVVLAGSLDGVLKAFDTRNGELLWQFDTVLPLSDIHGNPGQGGTIDSVGPIVAGNEILLNSGYSVFNIGGRNAYQAGPGNALMVFTLPASQLATDAGSP